MSNRNENLIPTAAQIKAHRQELGLSQVEYAARLGVSRSTVGHWESSRCSPSEAMANQIMVLMDGANPNPQTITIDWQALVGEHQGIRGVSLRHLVGLGLYATYRDASLALERDLSIFEATSKITLAADGAGRPGSDYIITSLKDVQMFCARARTEMGSRLLEVILAHHNELQAMLAGDPDAQARHEQAKPSAPADGISALRAMLDEMERQRDALAAQHARQQELEREVEVTRQSAHLTSELVTEQAQRLADVELRLNTTPIAGHLSAYQIAQRGGYVSSKGRPHESVISALGYEMGLEEEGESYQIMSEINGQMCPSRRYTPTGAALILNELRRLAKASRAPFFNVMAGGKTYTVYSSN